jgi:8-oxo-dGTP diphosphatase
MKYVVGLLFSDDLKQVVLIKKNKPEWQKGLLNGPGGKVEKTDPTAFYAMRREIREETGLTIDNWRLFFVQIGILQDYIVNYYIAKTDYAQLNQIKSTTDEVVGVYDVKYLDPTQLVNTLAWAIPLAIYNLSGQMDQEAIVLKC